MTQPLLAPERFSFARSLFWGAGGQEAGHPAAAAAAAEAPHDAQHCVRGDAALSAEKSWYWGWGSKKAASAAVADLSTVLPAAAARRFAGVVCAGWVDMYHVPLTRAAEFASLASHFARHRLFHEVALGTIFHIMSGGSAPGREEVLGGCFGCCCCDVAAGVDPVALLAAYKCGHRLNLRDGRTRDALQAALSRSSRDENTV